MWEFVMVILWLVSPSLCQNNCGLSPCLNLRCAGLLPNSTAPCRVAFRLDDVQDYFVVPAQMAIMETFRSLNNTPLTVGIIGSSTKFGNDKVITNYLQGVVTNPSWEVEIACHGSNHTDFSQYTEAQAIYQIQDGVRNIKAVLGVPYVTTFVPPFNLFNNNTVPALKALNFTHWSAQLGTDFDPHKPLSGQTFYAFPIGAATNDLSDDGTFVGQPWQFSFAAVQSQINYMGWSAVMMHPQEFTIGAGLGPTNNVNMSQIEQLILLITAVKQQGWEIIPLGRLNLDAPNKTLTGSITGFMTSEQAASVGNQDDLQRAYIIVGAVFAGLFVCLCFVFLAAFIRQSISYKRLY